MTQSRRAWPVLLCLLVLLLAACGETTAPPEVVVATQVPPAPTVADPSEEPTEDPAEEAPREDPTEEPEDGGGELTEVANFDGIRAFVEGEMANGIPGVAVAIVQGNEIIFDEGFGTRNVDTGEPVTPETLFHIASTQKSMTAMLVGTLVDEGVVEWDTPVVEIYPDFQLSDPEATEQVTLRHLLEMSSGIPDEAEYDLDFDSSAEDVFGYIAEVELLGLPGEEYSYSNISNSLAGYLAVLAAGGEFGDLYNGYERLLRERVLEPIGMEQIYFGVTEARAQPDHAVSHELDENGEPVVAESYDVDEDPLAPSGVIKTNVRDMARYVITQMNGGQAPDGTRVISREVLAETWVPNTGIGDGTYGMGWITDEYEGVQIIYHDGSYDGFTSIIGFLPEENLGFVVLANSEETETLLYDFVALLIDELVMQ